MKLLLNNMKKQYMIIKFKEFNKINESFFTLSGIILLISFLINRILKFKLEKSKDNKTLIMISSLKKYLFGIKDKKISIIKLADRYVFIGKDNMDDDFNIRLMDDKNIIFHDLKTDIEIKSILSEYQYNDLLKIIQKNLLTFF